MIIDFHAHIFPDHMAAGVIDKLSRLSRSIAFTDGTFNVLAHSMDNANIDLSIILPVATNDHQVKKLNDLAARSNERQSKTFTLGAMHPDFTNYAEELSRIAQLGLKGIKIHPVYQQTNIDDIKFLRILDRAAELNLFVVTHAGADIGFPGAVHCRQFQSDRRAYGRLEELGRSVDNPRRHQRFHRYRLFNRQNCSARRLSME